MQQIWRVTDQTLSRVFGKVDPTLDRVNNNFAGDTNQLSVILTIGIIGSGVEIAG